VYVYACVYVRVHVYVYVSVCVSSHSLNCMCPPDKLPRTRKVGRLCTPTSLKENKHVCNEKLYKHFLRSYSICSGAWPNH